MLKKTKFFTQTVLMVLILVSTYPATVIAETANFELDANTNEITPVEKRAEQEREVLPNPFAITLYRPNYLIPFYYTGSPYQEVYNNATPNNESINHGDIKFQLSFKVPVWRNILSTTSSLYFAYSQLSYWQAYNKIAFFRETDYEPEIFLQNEIHWKLLQFFHLNFFNIGASHQSNGFGNNLERSWNRIYIEAIASGDRWMLSLKPWIIIHDSATTKYNPNIGHYLGYGRVLGAYKWCDQVFSLSAYNFLESGGRRGSAQLTWSFPLTSYVRGYVQGFSGYGQSLIEYDHRTNSIGIGIALNDWI